MERSPLRMPVFVSVVVLSCFVLPTFVGAAEPSGAPDGGPCVQLPRLRQELVLDGGLTEWSGAAVIPFHLASFLASPSGAPPWGGVQDLSADAYCAWNRDGICLAAQVVDDQVFNDRTGVDIWQMDCLEAFVDGRVGDDLMAPSYSKGAYQLFVRAPHEPGPAAVLTNPRDGTIEGASAATRRTERGYAVEAVIPWSAFPGLVPEPGTQIGLAFQFDDYDPEDGPQRSPNLRTVMAYRGVADLWRDPSLFTRWELVEQTADGEDAWLGPMVNADMPLVLKGEPPRRATVRLGSALAQGAKAVRLVLTDAAGETFVDAAAGVEPAEEPWATSGQVSVPLPDVAGAAGMCTLKAIVVGREGEALGATSWPVMFTGAAIERAIERVSEANVAEMAQGEPFRAAAWLGVAAGVQRLQRAVELGEPTTALERLRETEARLSVLDGSWDALPREGLLDLLALSAESAAQVVVEYSEPGLAAVVFNWGSVPLGVAMVHEWGSAERARASLPGVTAPHVRQVTVDGNPAVLSTGTEVLDIADLCDFDSERHALHIQGNEAFIQEMHDLAGLEPAAVVFSADCPEQMRSAVTEMARREGWPIVEDPASLEGTDVLAVGDFPEGPVADMIGGCIIFRSEHRERGVGLDVALDTRSVSVAAPSQQAAEWLVSRIADGGPVTVEQADELRAMLVGSLKPEGPALQTEPGAEMFCGDVHMHTFYSDGNCSPAALMLEAIYCGLDFAVISDHNTIEGAELAVKQLQQCGFAFPVVVGEEITTPVHMNAFPLQKPIAWDMSPEQTVAEAHGLGAFIQWNHPWTDSDWGRQHLGRGLVGTGFDAWEHLPPRYEEWKRDGTLPLVVGSTDTHNGTFAGYGAAERTAVWARSADGTDLADALRAGSAVAVIGDSGTVFCGSDAAMAAGWAALADGPGLKQMKADRLKAALKDADPARLIQMAAPAP